MTELRRAGGGCGWFVTVRETGVRPPPMAPNARPTRSPGGRAGRFSYYGIARKEGVDEMKDSARYVKIVEWSEEDRCYVGSAPGLIFGGCHGDDEKAVFEELCNIVDEAIELYRRDGKPLPPPTSGRDFANKMQTVA